MDSLFLNDLPYSREITLASFVRRTWYERSFEQATNSFRESSDVRRRPPFAHSTR